MGHPFDLPGQEGRRFMVPHLYAWEAQPHSGARRD